MNKFMNLALLTGTACALAQDAPRQIADMKAKLFAENVDRAMTGNGVVKGSPFSATIVSTTTQTLGDGNHISNKSEMKIARDSEGRLRREQNLASVGPWSTKQTGLAVVIVDPVANMQYMITPGNTVAVKTPFKSANGDGGAKAKLELDAIMKAGAKTVALEKEKQAKSMAVADKSKKVLQLEPESPETVTSLGTQMIEGVLAEGKRSSRTISAGAIGNEKAIEITSESWYSQALQMVVLSKRSDPRTGDSEFRLTNISRAEPARSLFDPPAGN